MKAEDVMRALECCTSGRPCRECEYKDKSKDTFGCRKGLLIDALVLLREKDGEIEMLQGALKAEERHNELTMGMAKKALANARADTVRKMHSEIKERCIKGGIYPAFVARTIDQIAKEMLEENE